VQLFFLQLPQESLEAGGPEEEWAPPRHETAPEISRSSLFERHLGQAGRSFPKTISSNPCPHLRQAKL